MTKSHAAAHESWLVRCSPCTLAFSQNNLHDINHGRLPILLHNYHSSIKVQQQEPAPPSPHFHFVASISSKNSAMVAIAKITPNRGQQFPQNHHTWRVPQDFHKSYSNSIFSHFTIDPLLFAVSLFFFFFFSLQPSK